MRTTCLVRRVATGVMSTPTSVEGVAWLFGYGANMNAAHLQHQKGVRVRESRPCVLPHYRLRFNLASVYDKCEPVFANIERTESASDEVHGVAFALDAADMAAVDRFESSYRRLRVALRSYTNECLDGFVYVNKAERPTLEEDGTPSRRYLALLLRGAREAGLKRCHLRRLASTPTYRTSQDDLLRRQEFLARPKESFPALSWQQLTSPAVSLFGYLFARNRSWNPNINSLLGKEVSQLLLDFYHGAELRSPAPPPYPTLGCLEREDPDGLDYLLTWLDCLLSTSVGCVGRLIEYEEQACERLRLPQHAVFPEEELRLHSVSSGYDNKQ